MEKSDSWVSSALKVNLERTAAEVQIRCSTRRLLEIVKDHYGLRKRPASF